MVLVLAVQLRGDRRDDEDQQQHRQHPRHLAILYWAGGKLISGSIKKYLNIFCQPDLIFDFPKAIVKHLSEYLNLL